MLLFLQMSIIVQKSKKDNMQIKKNKRTSSPLFLDHQKGFNRERMESYKLIKCKYKKKKIENPGDFRILSTLYGIRGDMCTKHADVTRTSISMKAKTIHT